VNELHKVYLSYHKGADEIRRRNFEIQFGGACEVILPDVVGLEALPEELPPDVARQRIREQHLRDSVVTVVLVGVDSWRSRYVDWEIGATLQGAADGPGGALLGILLPSYSATYAGFFNTFSPDGAPFYPYTLPPRLYDNVANSYAPLVRWTDNPLEVRRWINVAWSRRSAGLDSDNSFPHFACDRDGERWYR
jgi:hypothetical protein